MTQMSCQP